MDQNKIKICHIASVDITVKFLLLPQLKFLQSQGYQVSAVCSPGKWVDEIRKEGINIKTIKISRKISPFRDLISLFQLYFYIKKEKFDIVHTHTPKPGLIGQLAAKIAGVSIIINTVHGLYFQKNSSPLKRKIFIFIEKISAKCSTLIFSQNKEDIVTIINEKISKPEKIEYLGNGTDMERFNITKFSKEEILNRKKDAGIKEGSKVVGIVGRLVKEKGYLDLFEAFKKVLVKIPDATLLIIGPEEPGKKDSLDKSIVKDYGIESNIIFLGERADVENFYPLMDVFVLPSYREGFPRTIIEAMAMQRPVVATNIRGCREEVEERETGFLVPVKDPKELSEKILTILEDENMAKSMGLAGRKRAEDNFDERAIFAKINKEYQKLLIKK